MYYRVMDKERSLFEDAEDRGAYHECPYTKEELLEMENPPVNPENVKFDKEINTWIEVIQDNAVCCCEGAENMVDYISNAFIDSSSADLKVVEFDGEYVGDCADGDIVRPEKLISEYSIDEFLNKFK